MLDAAVISFASVQEITKEKRSLMQVFDPQKAAIREVEKLLQHPEDLRQLPSLLEENSRKLQVSRGPRTVTEASLLPTVLTKHIDKKAPGQPVLASPVLPITVEKELSAWSAGQQKLAEYYSGITSRGCQNRDTSLR